MQHIKKRDERLHLRRMVFVGVLLAAGFVSASIRVATSAAEPLNHRLPARTMLFDCVPRNRWSYRYNIMQDTVSRRSPGGGLLQYGRCRAI